MWPSLGYGQPAQSLLPLPHAVYPAALLSGQFLPPLAFPKDQTIFQVPHCSLRDPPGPGRGGFSRPHPAPNARLSTACSAGRECACPGAAHCLSFVLRAVWPPAATSCWSARPPLGGHSSEGSFLATVPKQLPGASQHVAQQQLMVPGSLLTLWVCCPLPQRTGSGGGGEECSRVPRLSAVGLFAAGESHCRARAASCSGLGGAPCAAACERGPEAGNLGLPWRSSLGLGGRKGGQILGPEETLIAQFHCCLPWPYLALKAPPCPPGVGSKASPSPPPPPGLILEDTGLRSPARTSVPHAPCRSPSVPCPLAPV